MPKKVLITGGEGQLGRTLIAELSDAYDILATDVCLSHEAVVERHVIAMDITNLGEVCQLMDSFQPDYIINSAAYTNVDGSEDNRKLAWDINVNGLENLIKASRKTTRLIHISSDYVFDGKKGNYSETDPTYPASYYGRTKLAGENLIRGARDEFLIIRPNVLYRGVDKDAASFVAWVYQSLSAGKEIRVVTDQLSNPTWAFVLARAIRQCMIMNATGIYHYGSDNVINRYDFALEVAKIFNLNTELISPITTDELQQKAPRPMNSSLNIQKIQEETGAKTFTTEYCLQEIKRTLKTR